ncbi:MAG: hypothetical protein AB7G76_11665 [Steroidobacteraceae bacterium]
MDTRSRRCLRQVITGAVVVGAHLLVLLLATREIRSRNARATQPAVVVTSIRWSEPLSEARQRRGGATTPAARLLVPVAPRVQPLPAVPQPAAPPAAAPSRDWHGAAREAARAAIDAAPPPPRPFGVQPQTPYRECGERKSFEWNPEPGRGGFAAGLPYVRLGKRCVVGLGFFGCAMGELPKANGELLDDMDAPERDRSSVPRLDDCLRPGVAPLR